MTRSFPTHLPTDVYSLKALGVDSWLETFFWPVSDTQFYEMVDSLWSAFDRLYEGLDQTGRDVILSDTGFIGFLAQHLHALAVEASCREKGMEILSQKISKEFYAPDFEALASEYRLKLQRRGPWWKWTLRNLAKQVKFNRRLPSWKRLSGLLFPCEAWSLGSYSSLKSEYAKASKLYLSHPYWQGLAGRVPDHANRAFSEYAAPHIESFFQTLMQSMRESFGVDFDPVPLARVWLQRLGDLHAVYEHVRTTARAPRLLLVSELVNSMHKVISLAFKRTGTAIIGFHHGNDMGNTRFRVFGYAQAAHLNTYVCPTATSAEYHRAKYALCGIGRYNPVDFVSTETHWYEYLFAQGTRRPMPERVRRVMVIGFPMNATRYQYSDTDFFLFQMDLELRILRLLKRHGYETIYKVHPERQEEVSGIYGAECDLILADPFEKVWDQADAVVYPSTSSSTFGYALCTNRPIAAIDMKGRKWNPEAYELLSRRCTMVPAWPDDRNRVQFDEERLLSALSANPGPTDFSYVEKTMFPLRPASHRAETPGRGIMQYAQDH